VLDCELEGVPTQLDVLEVVHHIWQSRCVLLVAQELPGDILDLIASAVCHTGSEWVISASSANHRGFQPKNRAPSGNYVPSLNRETEGSVTIVQKPNIYMISRKFDEVFFIHRANRAEGSLVKWCKRAGHNNPTHRRC
jgi:hypothetical protein